MSFRYSAAIWAVLILLGGLVTADPAGAQAPATANAAPAAAASPSDIRRVIATLDDPAARARLIADLNALLQAETRQQPATSAAAAPPTPSDWLSRSFAAISAGIAALASDVAAAGRMAREWPRVTSWLTAELTDPVRVRQNLELLLRLAIVLAAAALAEWLVSRLIRRPRRAIEQWTPAHLAGRWLLLAARVVLALIPLCAFVAAASIALPLTTPDETTRQVVIVLINANILARAILAVGRRVLAPDRLTDGDSRAIHRLLHIADGTAREAYRWLRRLTWVGVYGYFLIRTADLLGLPVSVRDLLFRLIGLGFTTMLVVLILQHRRAIGRAIAGPAWQPAESTDDWRLLRSRLAEIWHVLAISYVVGAFVVWALAVRNGLSYLAHGTLWTAVILIGLRLALVGLRRLERRAGAALANENGVGLPLRARSYLPLARTALHSILSLVAGLCILEAWGVDIWGWFQSPIGQRILSSALSIALILALAIAVWEIASLMITRALTISAAASSPQMRGARMRTLLPLLRNALSIVIVVLTSLIVLSEIGINIAPLLAGAGVVGLAIGFGAQTLVKDVITGLFFLLEDTVNVGDVVDVGGRSGVVESLTIRSIRLRDLEGAVHTVPFSAVAAIKNMTKDFGYCILDILVDYRSNLDQAIAVMKALDVQMRADPEYGPWILEPLEVMGVERFADNAVVLRCRVKTVAIRRWAVCREFNRRLKNAFYDAGIGMVAGVPLPEPEPRPPEPAPAAGEPEPAHASS